MTSFAEISVDCLLVEREIPEHLMERFARIRDAALRHAVTQDADAARAMVERSMDEDGRPLADVMPLHQHSVKVDQ